MAPPIKRADSAQPVTTIIVGASMVAVLHSSEECSLREREAQKIEAKLPNSYDFCRMTTYYADYASSSVLAMQRVINGQEEALVQIPPKGYVVEVPANTPGAVRFGQEPSFKYWMPESAYPVAVVRERQASWEIAKTTVEIGFMTFSKMWVDLQKSFEPRPQVTFNNNDPLRIYFLDSFGMRVYVQSECDGETLQEVRLLDPVSMVEISVRNPILLSQVASSLCAVTSPSVDLPGASTGITGTTLEVKEEDK